MRILRRIPWIIWALLAPALILGAYRLVVGGGRRVAVVGSGVLEVLAEGDAPPGIRFDLQTRAQEPLEETRRRVEVEIATWPDIVVFGFHPSVLDEGVPAVQVALTELTQAIENAAGVPVVVGFALPADAPPARRQAAEQVRAWFRQTLCTSGRHRICVDPTEQADHVEGMRAAITSGVRDAIARHDALLATTQVGR